MPDGSYGGNPCGFVVETRDGNFYYSGDTALTYDMKLIGEQTRLDFAVLPIGDFFTMGIDDALRAAEFVGTPRIVGSPLRHLPTNQDRSRSSAESRTRGRERIALAKNRRDDFAVTVFHRRAARQINSRAF